MCQALKVYRTWGIACRILSVAEVPWESLDLLLRSLESQRGSRQALDKADEDRIHDVVLLEGESKPGQGDKWTYGVDIKEGAANKELDEARFQPDVKKK